MVVDIEAVECACGAVKSYVDKRFGQIYDAGDMPVGGYFVDGGRCRLGLALCVGAVIDGIEPVGAGGGGAVSVDLRTALLEII